MPFARDLSDAELDAAVASWRTEGWAFVPRVASEETLAALRARADALVAGQIRWPGMFFQAEADNARYEDLPHGQGWVGPTAAYRKMEKLELDPLFRAWIGNAVFERIVRRILPGPITLYRSVIFGKPAHRSSETPWHQDAGQLWGLDTDPEIQLWTALDDCPIGSGVVEVLPRSHRAGLATPLGGVVPRVQIAAADAEARKIPVPAHAGDVLLLHNHLWHRAGPNTTASQRRTFTVCYLPASTRCLRTKKAPRRFMPVWEP